MKALLYGPPTVQVRDLVHWRLWPGRAACGLGLSPAQQTPTPDRGVVTCEHCQGRLKSEYSAALFYVRVTSPGHRVITPDMLGVATLGPFPDRESAQATSSMLRWQMLRWHRVFGPGVRIGVVLDYRDVPSRAFPPMPPSWLGLTRQGDSPHQGDSHQGDRPSISLPVPST